MVDGNDVVFNKPIAVRTVLAGDNAVTTVGAKVTLKAEPTDALGDGTSGTGWYTFVVDSAVANNKAVVINTTFEFAAEADLGVGLSGATYGWKVAD